MNIYEETDYRKILETLVGERKKIDADFRFYSMASAMGVQKSYFSRVIHGHAELSSDQLFLACKYLNLNEPQILYLETLLEYSKSVVPEKRSRLEATIRRRQAENLRSQEHLRATPPTLAGPDFTLYYVDPLHQIVHISLLLDRFREAPSLLAEHLGVTPARILKSVLLLEKIGVLARRKGKLVVLIRQLHLPPSSEVYSVWRDQLKLMALQRLKAQPDAADYSFSVVFSSDLKTKEKIQRKFLNLLKDIEPLVERAPDDGVFQMSFDLFGWTDSPQKN